MILCILNGRFHRMLVTCTLVCLAIFYSPEVFAQGKQMTKKELKAEKKKWKKKAVAYKKNPLSLKAREEGFQKEVEDLKNRIKELTAKNAELQAELDKCTQKAAAEIRSLRYTNDSLRNELQRLQTAYESLKNMTGGAAGTDGSGGTAGSGGTTGSGSGAGGKGGTGTPGLWYRVQIGAYEKFNMNKHLEYTDENFTGESADNLNKYLIGKFKSYNLAQAFRNDIVKLGIRDAWVVAYHNGTRIDIKEAQKLQQQGK